MLVVKQEHSIFPDFPQGSLTHFWNFLLGLIAVVVFIGSSDLLKSLGLIVNSSIPVEPFFFMWTEVVENVQNRCSCSSCSKVMVTEGQSVHLRPFTHFG